MKLGKDGDLSFLSITGKAVLFILAAIIFTIISKIPIQKDISMSSYALRRFDILVGANFGTWNSLGVWPILLARIGIAAIDFLGRTKQNLHRLSQRIRGPLFLGLIILFSACGAIHIASIANVVTALARVRIVLILILVSLGVSFFTYILSLSRIMHGAFYFIAVGGILRFFYVLLGYNFSLDFSGQIGILPSFLIALYGKYPTELISTGIRLAMTGIAIYAAFFLASCTLTLPARAKRLLGVLRRNQESISFGSVAVPGLAYAGSMYFTLMLIADVVAAHTSLPRWLGVMYHGTPVGGLVFWLSGTNLMELWMRRSMLPPFLWSSIVHVVFNVILTATLCRIWGKWRIQSAYKCENTSSTQSPKCLHRHDLEIGKVAENAYTYIGALFGLVVGIVDISGQVISGSTSILIVLVSWESLHVYSCHLQKLKQLRARNRQFTVSYLGSQERRSAKAVAILMLTVGMAIHLLSMLLQG